MRIMNSTSLKTKTIQKSSDRCLIQKQNQAASNSLLMERWKIVNHKLRTRCQMSKRLKKKLRYCPSAEKMSGYSSHIQIRLSFLPSPN